MKRFGTIFSISTNVNIKPLLLRILTLSTTSLTLLSYLACWTASNNLKSFNPSFFVFSLPEYLIPWTNEQPTCCVQQNILEGQQCYIAKSVVEQSKSILFQTTLSTLHLPTTELPAVAKSISSSSSDSDSLSRSCGRAQEALTWVGIPSSPFISCPTSRSRFLPWQLLKLQVYIFCCFCYNSLSAIWCWIFCGQFQVLVWILGSILLSLFQVIVFVECIVYVLKSHLPLSFSGILTYPLVLHPIVKYVLWSRYIPDSLTWCTTTTTRSDLQINSYYTYVWLPDMTRMRSWSIVSVSEFFKSSIVLANDLSKPSIALGSELSKSFIALASDFSQIRNLRRNAHERRLVYDLIFSRILQTGFIKQFYVM